MRELWELGLCLPSPSRQVPSQLARRSLPSSSHFQDAGAGRQLEEPPPSRAACLFTFDYFPPFLCSQLKVGKQHDLKCTEVLRRNCVCTLTRKTQGQTNTRAQKHAPLHPRAEGSQGSAAQAAAGGQEEVRGLCSVLRGCRERAVLSWE